MDCPAEVPTDDMVLKQRVLHFLYSKKDSSVTGVRRMGSEAFVDYVAAAAEEDGLKASIFPDKDGDIILFYTWEGSEDNMKEVLDADPEADVMYGQELCHQVPAVVRYGKR